MFITILLSASIHGLRPYDARHDPGHKAAYHLKETISE